jgi:hypothetical protein
VEGASRITLSGILALSKQTNLPKYDSSLRNRWVILEGQERSWGWVLGLSFLCSVVCFVSLLCVAACLCVLFGFITSYSNFNKNQMISTT